MDITTRLLTLSQISFNIVYIKQNYYIFSPDLREGVDKKTINFGHVRKVLTPLTAKTADTGKNRCFYIIFRYAYQYTQNGLKLMILREKF